LSTQHGGLRETYLGEKKRAMQHSTNEEPAQTYKKVQKEMYLSSIDEHHVHALHRSGLCTTMVIPEPRNTDKDNLIARGWNNIVETSTLHLTGNLGFSMRRSEIKLKMKKSRRGEYQYLPSR
jgi:hypothetical protein